MIQQKPFTVTQGGADTAAESTLATNIQPGVTLGAWSIKGIELTLPPNLVKAYAAADADLTLQMTKRSLAGAIARLVSYTDTDLLLTFNLAVVLSGAAANLMLTETTWFISPPPELLVYSENIYMQLISTGTGATNIAWGRILYEPVTLTQAQALAVIASRP